MTDKVAIDDVYDILFFPLYLLWALVPSVVRKRIKTVPWSTFVFIGKILWTLALYYWIWLMISPYVGIPIWVQDVYDWMIQNWFRLQTYVGSRIPISKWSDFTVIFPTISLTGWITKWIWRPAPTLTEQIVDKAAETATAVVDNATAAAGQAAVIIKKGASYLSGQLDGLIYVPERAIEGSPIIPAKELPGFVCFIMGKTGNDYGFVGVGFRVENAILTAAHNLTGYEEIKIVSNSAEVIISTDKANVFPYDDLAYFLLSDRDFSMLQLTKGRLLDHAVPNGYPMMCQTFGPGTPVSFTMGVVKPVENFGKVSYSGTTTHGFSGSPYIQHKTIVGMHLGAGMVNMGLDAAYIHMLLTTRAESTEDWLIKMIEEDQLNKRQVTWERSPVDPSDIYIKRQGKYFVMDADTFFSTYEQQRIVTECNDVRVKTFNYPDSKNSAMAPAHENVCAGARGQISEIKSCVQTPLTANSYPTPSSIKNLEERLSMEHQEQMLAQQSDHSDCTLNDITYLPERNRRREQKNKKRSVKSQLTSSGPGSSGLELIR